jgi:hypothetical protein
MNTKKEFGNFLSTDDLKNWLLGQKIDLTIWNCGDAKSVENLFDELQHGDCSIQLRPPLRVIYVVQVFIIRDKSILVELEQEMSDHRKRKRNLPPSEKMKPGESWANATKRCLKEELQIEPDAIKIITKECKPSIRYRNSNSYPGLKTKYFIYRIHTEVNGLPEGNFWSEEETRVEDADVIRNHYWGWTHLKKIKYPD